MTLGEEMSGKQRAGTHGGKTRRRACLETSTRRVSVGQDLKISNLLTGPMDMTSVNICAGDLKQKLTCVEGLRVVPLFKTC